MNNQMTPQEVKKVLEELLEHLQGAGNQLKIKHIQSVIHAIQTLDAVIEVRMYLWLSHGHQEIYGDDGEMQCCKCSPWDYKRADLLEVVKGAIKSTIEKEVAKLKLEKERVERMRKIEQGAWEEVKKYQDENIKLQSQNKKLEEENNLWMKEKKAFAERILDLKSQLSALQKEKACEHDWQAEWVKSYTTSSGGTKMRCKKCLEVRWIYD